MQRVAEPVMHHDNGCFVFIVNIGERAHFL
jgi:hypothetical protein